MKSYLLPIRCPNCQGDLDHANGTCHAGTEAVAVAKCSRCSDEFTVSVQLRPLAAPSRPKRRRANA